MLAESCACYSTTVVLSCVCVIHVHAQCLHVEVTHKSNWHYFLMVVRVEAATAIHFCQVKWHSC